VRGAQGKACPALIHGLLQHRERLDEGLTVGVTGFGACEVDPLVLIQVDREHEAILVLGADRRSAKAVIVPPIGPEEDPMTLRYHYSPRMASWTRCVAKTKEAGPFGGESRGVIARASSRGA
jgi:hypothetical protein